MDHLVDKMNEYEEERIKRDREVTDVFNVCSDRASEYKSKIAKLQEKINHFEDLQSKLDEKNVELQSVLLKNHDLQSKFDEKNYELQSVFHKIDDQSDLKDKVISLSEEKEAMTTK